MDAFAPLVTVRQSDLQFEIVGATVLRACAVKRNERRHFNRQALFDVGRFQRAALDSDAAVRRRRGQPDRRQRPRRAIRTDVSEEAGAYVAARRRLELTLDDIILILRVSRERAGQQKYRSSEFASSHLRAPLGGPLTEVCRPSAAP